MNFPISEIAKMVGGVVKGDPKHVISGIASLKNAQAHHLAFFSDHRYGKDLDATMAGVVLVDQKSCARCSVNMVVVPDVYLAYAKISNVFSGRSTIAAQSGIHASACIEDGVRIEPDVYIGVNAYIAKNVFIGSGSYIGANVVIQSDVAIGTNTMVHANVTLYSNTRIGSRCIIHAGAVIGGDGFGFAYDANEKRWNKIDQLGGVVIGDDVEIGATTTIDRGAIEDTYIGNGVKLDNHIQIGHNVKIGDHTVIASITGIFGSTKIGQYCRIGAGSMIGGHLSIADHVTLIARTEVWRSIKKPGVTCAGEMAVDYTTWKKNMFRRIKLDDWIRRFQNLERKFLSMGKNDDYKNDKK